MAKKSPPKFKGLWIPAQLLEMKNISTIEKTIIADIAYFNGRDGYYFSYPAIAKKFGIGRMTVIRAIERLSSPKLGMIYKTGDEYHRRLRVSEDIAALFNNVKAAPPKQAKTFSKPTASEVTEYAASIDFELDGKYFVDYYEARGWMVGKNKMKDWKAAVRTWKKRDNDGSSKISGSNQPAEPFIR